MRFKLRAAYISMVARFPALLSLALLLLAACHRAGVGSPDVPRGEGATAITAFENVSVIPMDTDRVLVGQMVLVRGGVITAVGPSASVAVPRGAVRIDGSGGYLVPGLADMHVHLYDDVGLASYLANGVTTVANPLFVSITTPGDARLIAAEQKAAGYDFVKAYSFLDPDVYQALTAEARARGIAVDGRAVGGCGEHTGVRPGRQLRLRAGHHARRGRAEERHSVARRLRSAGPLQRADRLEPRRRIAGHRAGDRGRADLGDGDLRERRAGAPRGGPRRQRVGDLGARLHE
ncbi:MAG: hypothetical protein WKG32_05290 [Gemmatimonadaceae bacterium]